MNDPTDAATMRCPVCQAEQAWSAQCRRCKCDLALLEFVHRSIDQLEQDCLFALARNEFSCALELAHIAWRWRPSDSNCRRLAVCNLLRGDWSAALKLVLADENPQDPVPAALGG